MSSPNRYTALHTNPQGPGDSRPTADRIIDDEGILGEWTDKTIVLTGAAGGIGVDTARALAATGANLILTVRNLTQRETFGELLNSEKIS